MEAPARVPREGPVRARYELRGVLHHLGQNAFEGHYVTDVREASSIGLVAVEKDEDGGEAEGNETGGRGGRWKRHDDSVVLPLSEAMALDGAAQRTCYICFYSLVQ